MEYTEELDFDEAVGGYDIHDKNFRHLLEYAPQTVIFQILLNMPHEDLEYFCSINKRVRDVCREHNVKVEYYKKNPIVVVDSFEEAKAFLKKNPNGFLHISKNYKPKDTDLKAIGDRIVYLDTTWGPIAVFKRLKVKENLPNLKKITVYRSNGQKHLEFNYKDGKKDGKQYIWYKNGQKLYEENYKNGQDGKQYGWYSNGQKQYEVNYKDGKKDGKQYGWYSNGQKQYEENYKNGQEDGKQYGWYYNDQLKYEKNFKNGKKDGKQYKWNENGEKKYEENYKNGKIVGDKGN